MNYQFIFHAEFDQDVADVENWYERKEPGTGLQFTRNVRDTLQELPDNPMLYAIKDRRLKIRWLPVIKYPYQIPYRISAQYIYVLGVFHAARHARHWRKRARSIDSGEIGESYSAT